MRLKTAVKKLREALDKDETFFAGHQARIARTFYDAVKRHDKARISEQYLWDISNEAAQNFLRTWIDGEELK